MAKESLAAKVAREAEERLAKIEARRMGFKAPVAVQGDVIPSRPSGTGRKSSLAKGGKDVLSAIGKIKKPKKKKADPWIDPDKKKAKTPKAKDETKDDWTFVDDFGDTGTGSDDYTFVDDFGDTDYSGSDWDWDAPFKHGGRIKKAKKAKAESRKPRSRPAIRGRRRELKGS